MNIIYKNTISVNEYNKIRSSVGWTEINSEQAKEGLNGRTLVLNAIDGEKSIGMASLIWDGGFVALIKDVIVIPEYQKRGIEKELVNKIINFLQNKLKPEYSIQIDVKTFDDIEIFKEIGFQISTKEKRGIPMHLCISFKEE